MSRSTSLQLSRKERQDLLALTEDPATSTRLALRASIVLDLAAGATRQETAARFGTSVPTVALWHKRYKLGGIDILRDRSRPGRPRIAAIRAVGSDEAVAGAEVAEVAVPRTPTDARLSEVELDRLLGAARRTISRRGFSATRVADIAVEAGVSPSTIHYYFKTKNEILVRALLWASERLLPRLDDLGAESEDAVTLLARYIERTIPYPGVQRDEYLLEIDLWSHIRLHPELLPPWESYEQHWIAHVTELITRGKSSGEFNSVTPAAELAERLVALTDGLSAQTAIKASRMPTERARDLILRFASEQFGVPLEVLEQRARLSQI